MQVIKEGLIGLVGKISDLNKISLEDIPQEDSTYYGNQVMNGKLSLQEAAQSLKNLRRVKDSTESIADWIVRNY